MKVTVSFEIDTTDFPAYNASTKKEIRGSVQEVSTFFSELHTAHLEAVMNAHVPRGLEPEVQGNFIKHLQSKAKLSKQLFNKFRMQGVTDDGHPFDFTHEEPGCKEQLIVDGVDVNKPVETDRA